MVIISRAELERAMVAARIAGFQEGLNQAAVVESANREDPQRRIYEQTGVYPSRDRIEMAGLLRSAADEIERGKHSGVMLVFADAEHGAGYWWIEEAECAQLVIDTAKEFSDSISDSSMWIRSGRRFMRRPITKQ